MCSVCGYVIRIGRIVAREHDCGISSDIRKSFDPKGDE